MKLQNTTAKEPSAWGIKISNDFTVTQSKTHRPDGKKITAKCVNLHAAEMQALAFVRYCAI